MEPASGDAGSGGAAQEPVHLTALALLHDLTKDPSEMGFVKEMEEEAGVEIEWEVVRGSDWNQVKATRFASGDIPDILIGGATNTGDYATYSGLFLDMAPYNSAELTPNIEEMFEDEPVTKALASSQSGEIYGLPRLLYGVNPDTTRVLFINQQWLDNLGLEMPTTFSELRDVLKAFKEQDANGNGDPDDEIPLDFNGLLTGMQSATEMFLGSLGIQITNPPAYYFAEGGEVKCYAVDERFKLMMEYLSGMYEDGLINSGVLTDDYSQFQSLGRGNEAGDALVGVTIGWEQTDRFGTDLAQQYVVLAPLAYDIDCEAGTYDTRFVIENSIPDDLYEAAVLDGCSHFTYFWRVVLPLSKAVISVLILYYAVFHWNDYFNAMVFNTKEEYAPLQSVLRRILLMNQAFANGVGSGSGGWAQDVADQVKYAVIIVSTLPILCVYPFIQKYFEKGVMIGSVKG